MNVNLIVDKPTFTCKYKYNYAVKIKIRPLTVPHMI